jgi:hypothetical protein
MMDSITGRFSIEDYPHNDEPRTDTDGWIVNKARQLDKLLFRIQDIVEEIELSDHPNKERIVDLLEENEIPVWAWATHCVATGLLHPERWKTDASGIRYRAQRQVDKQPGYIYFCKVPDKPGVKVGSTQDIDRRMKQLDGELLLFLDVYNMAEAENWLHVYLEAVHIKDEQFDLSYEGVTRAVNHMIDSDEIDLPKHVSRL